MQATMDAAEDSEDEQLGTGTARSSLDSNASTASQGSEPVQTSSTGSASPPAEPSGAAALRMPPETQQPGLQAGEAQPPDPPEEQPDPSQQAAVQAAHAARALSMIPETRPHHPGSPPPEASEPSEPAQPAEAKPEPQAGLLSRLQAFFSAEDVTWTCPQESAPQLSESEEPSTPGRARLQRRSVSFSGVPEQLTGVAAEAKPQASCAQQS